MYKTLDTWKQYIHLPHPILRLQFLRLHLPRRHHRNHHHLLRRPEESDGKFKKKNYTGHGMVSDENIVL